MKLMAIDGNSLINRAFYGVRQLSTRSGIPTNAVYGFLNMYLKLIADENPDAVCVCFDLPGGGFRHEMYEEYKAQRKPMPDELAVQIPMLKELLDLMGVPRLEQEGYEADDLLGTLARISREAGDECLIVTGDRDSLQFIGQGADVDLIITRMGQTTTEKYDENLFKEKYEGLTPDKIVDLKALMGDASDNIPGVKGIGEKGAMSLLTRFGSLDNIYANLDDESITPSLRKKLDEGREMAYLSYRLATGETGAPIGVKPGGLKLRPADRSGLYAFLDKYEMRSLIKRLELSPGEGERPDTGFVPPEVKEAAMAGELEEVLTSAGEGPVFCAFSPGLEACALTADGPVYVMMEESDPEGYRALLDKLAEGKLVAHDVKPALRAFLSRGMAIKTPFFDTAIAAYLLDSTAGSYPLGRCAETLLGFAAPALNLLEAGDAFSPLGDREGAKKALGLACGLTRALYRLLEPRLRETEMLELMKKVELPLVPVLAEMEELGVRVDRQRLLSFGEGLTGEIEALEEDIYALAGERFNIGSPKQMGAILFEKLGLKAYKKTKTGYSTDVEALGKLKGEHEIIGKILDWRQLTKLKSTYVESLVKVIGEDGRIHSTFHQMVAATGRLSSSDPNLQNIPIRRERGSEIRRCFVPREGWVLVDADYSQIELRILAHIADDQSMIDAFSQDEDIHSVTASQVFGVPLGEVTSQLRSRAKAVNFGIVYGISAYSLSEGIGVFPKQAQSYIDAYLEHYKGVRTYMEQIKERAREQGYVRSLAGRIRYLPELKSGNFNTRSFGERVALNMPIQGTAADIIKLAMIGVSERLKREGHAARLILQVHDELILECPPDEVEKVGALLRQEMQGAMALKVELPAEVNVGENWYDAKG